MSLFGFFYFGSEVVILVAKVCLWQRQVELFWLDVWNEIINYSSTRKQILLTVILWGLGVALSQNLKKWELGRRILTVLWDNRVAHTMWVLEMELPLESRVAEVFLGWGLLCKQMFQPSHHFCGLPQHFQFCFPCNYCNPVTHSSLALGRQTKTRGKAAVHGCGGQSQGFVGWICCSPVTWPGGNFLQMLSNTWARQRLFKCCFLICALGPRNTRQLEDLVWKPRLAIIQTAFGKAVKAKKKRRQIKGDTLICLSQTFSKNQQVTV